MHRKNDSLCSYLEQLIIIHSIYCLRWHLLVPDFQGSSEDNLVLQDSYICLSISTRFPVIQWGQCAMSGFLHLSIPIRFPGILWGQFGMAGFLPLSISMHCAFIVLEADRKLLEPITKKVLIFYDVLFSLLNINIMKL